MCFVLKDVCWLLFWKSCVYQSLQRPFLMTPLLKVISMGPGFEEQCRKDIKWNLQMFQLFLGYIFSSFIS